MKKTPSKQSVQCLTTRLLHLDRIINLGLAEEDETGIRNPGLGDAMSLFGNAMKNPGSTSIEVYRTAAKCRQASWRVLSFK